VDVCLIYRVVAACIHPISSTDLITPKRAYFLYALLQDTPINFATHAIRTMGNIHRIVTNTALPFGGLIMKVVKMVGVQALHGGDIQKPLGPFNKRFISMSMGMGHLTKAASQQQGERDPKQPSDGATGPQQPPQDQACPHGQPSCLARCTHYVRVWMPTLQPLGRSRADGTLSTRC
jgi:hypothetical protein